MELTNQIDMWVSLVLTMGAVVANFASTGYAVKVGLMLNSCPWLTLRGDRHLAMQILLGGILVCGFLGCMKIWSVTHIFLVRWDLYPHIYHIESFLYLLENYGVAVLLWKYATYMKRIASYSRPEDEPWTIVKDCQNEACITRNSCIANVED